jgi:hypothetical protein
MSGFESLSKPLKPRSEVAVHTLHPTLEQKPRAKYSVPDWFNHKYEFYVEIFLIIIHNIFIVMLFHTMQNVVEMFRIKSDKMVDD